MSTVRGRLRTTPRAVASELHDAFNSDYGCDKAAVVIILAHCDARQRALIQREYEVKYRERFLERLSSVLKGKLKTSVLLWMRDSVGRDAWVVRQGLEKKNLQAVTEVICSRTPSEIQNFRQQYDSTWGSLEDDIERQASGDHRRLLLAYVSTHRDEGLESDRERAVEDSQALFEAGVRTDNMTFINIFSERNRAQLAAVISAYRDMYENSLERAVMGRRRGLFEYALWTILSCSENPARYFAKVLHNAMKCLGTDDTTLIRVIVTRTEFDMQYIKAEYQTTYKKKLYDAVHSETSGRYRTFLLSLLGPNHEPNDR